MDGTTRHFYKSEADLVPPVCQGRAVEAVMTGTPGLVMAEATCDCLLPRVIHQNHRSRLITAHLDDPYHGFMALASR